MAVLAKLLLAMSVCAEVIAKIRTYEAEPEVQACFFELLSSNLVTVYADEGRFILTNALPDGETQPEYFRGIRTTKMSVAALTRMVTQLEAIASEKPEWYPRTTTPQAKETVTKTTSMPMMTALDIEPYLFVVGVFIGYGCLFSIFVFCYCCVLRPYLI